jgi:hypothetical protein
MNLESLSAAQRAEATAATARRAQTRQDQAQFFGSGGINAAGGETIPATTLSNGPVRAGQPVPMLQAGGSVEYDTVSRSEPEEPLIPLLKRGNIKVCLQVSLANGDVQFWLGGDRITPVLITTVLASDARTVLECEFEATGPQKNDWIFAIKTASSAGPRLQTFAGDGSTTDSGINSKVEAMSYKGAKFWATEAIAQNFIANPNRTSTGTPGSSYQLGFTLPGAASLGGTLTVGPDSSFYSQSDIFPRIATNFTPSWAAFPFTLQIQGSGSYRQDITESGLISESSFNAQLYGQSDFTIDASSESTLYSGSFSESFTANSVAAYFFDALQEDATGTDYYQSSTTRSGETTGQRTITRQPLSGVPTFGTTAAFITGINSSTGLPVVGNFSVSGTPAFSDSSLESSNVSRAAVYPINLSPTLRLENTIDYRYSVSFALGSSSPPNQTTTAHLRKTYRSLKTFDAATTVFYSREEAQGDAAQVTGFRYDTLVVTSAASQSTTAFYLKFGAATPLLLAAPPAAPYNDYTWVKTSAALQLYKVDPQPFLIDSSGTLTIAILKADIKAEVATQVLNGDTFNPIQVPAFAKALAMRINGASSQNTTIIRAHFWPKSS